MIKNFPLCWPEGWKRTPGDERERGRFKQKDNSKSYRCTQQVTIASGVDRVLYELERMGIDEEDTIISTNVRVRLDGLPRSGERAPDDPGVAVYWKKENEPMRSMAIDRYLTVADNLAAIAATLDAMRAIERHGGAEILDRTFRGFTALPEKACIPWRVVLGLGGHNVTLDEVRSKYRELVKQVHPDTSEGDGDRVAFEAITSAWADAQRELGG